MCVFISNFILALTFILFLWHESFNKDDMTPLIKYSRNEERDFSRSRILRSRRNNDRVRDAIRQKERLKPGEQDRGCLIY